MIILTLGTIPYPFERAVRWLEILLDNQTITEPVFVQSGATDVSAIAHHPLVTTARVVESKHLIESIHQARLVISHAGQGSTCMLAAQKASFVLIPRLSQYGEHIDNHQLLFAQSVRQFGVRYCLKFEDLEAAVQNPPPPAQGRLFTGPKLTDHLIQIYPDPVSSASPERSLKLLTRSRRTRSLIEKIQKLRKPSIR